MPLPLQNCIAALCEIRCCSCVVAFTVVMNIWRKVDDQTSASGNPSLSLQTDSNKFQNNSRRFVKELVRVGPFRYYFCTTHDEIESGVFRYYVVDWLVFGSTVVINVCMMQCYVYCEWMKRINVRNNFWFYVDIRRRAASDTNDANSMACTFKLNESIAEDYTSTHSA